MTKPMIYGWRVVPDKAQLQQGDLRLGPDGRVAVWSGDDWQTQSRPIPLTWFSAADLLDPEPVPPVKFEKPDRPSLLVGRAIPRRQDATVPSEASDPDHPDHADWVVTAERCFADHDHQEWLEEQRADELLAWQQIEDLDGYGDEEDE